ncbi:hypothetical protein BpHYR1_002450 [Brachionus plicatilis]|uniref:Methyltransferase FkbM domain-containing protein n=1 Tax=Brachionus plicatilis TaxID=10195 RepID=A0A3M7SBS3_BRAPC|nr:hypothetical protein BpHYR1_002450 [Brachionus plicatilis]
MFSTYVSIDSNLEPRGSLSDLEIVNSKPLQSTMLQKPKAFCPSFLIEFRYNEFRCNEQEFPLDLLVISRFDFSQIKCLILSKFALPENTCLQKLCKLIRNKNSIKCRKSSKFVVSTTLCVHDLKRDQFVSSAIWKNGVYEPELVDVFTKFIEKREDLIVFDIGAQIGQYSLFAAKIGRSVISVEPFFDSVLRIKKAAIIEGIENKITLLQLGISNKREKKELSYVPNNIGGQSLFSSDKNNKSDFNIDEKNFIVRTILLDDLINFLPTTFQGNNYKNGVMKIDIEGYEPYAFEHSKRLFDTINFELILMEWNLILKNKLIYRKNIENMIKMFQLKGLAAFENNKKLNISLWETWPNKIFWVKEKN